jgi:hypothetical protein
MGKIIVKNAVVRQPGYLYYISGNGDLMSAKMATRGKSKKTEAKAEVKTEAKKVEAKKAEPKTAKKTDTKKKAKK